MADLREILHVRARSRPGAVGVAWLRRRQFRRPAATEARATVEFIIFKVLDHYVKPGCVDAYRRVIDSTLIDPAHGLQAISLNYDIVLDLAMCDKGNGLPDYRCDIQTEPYQRFTHYGRLLKLHGSVNWAFCPGCQRLEIGMTENGVSLASSRQLKELYALAPLDKHYLCSDVSCTRCQCRECGVPLRPVMITPSFVKDYRNPHIQQVWYEAEQLCRGSNHAYIIGYSLPNDDLEVIHMLRRGLWHLAPGQVTVVLGSPDPEIMQRYRTHFGNGIEFCCDGFERWADTALVQGKLASSPAPTATVPNDFT